MNRVYMWSTANLSELYKKVSGMPSFTSPKMADPLDQDVVELEFKHLLRASLAMDGEVWAGHAKSLLLNMRDKGLLLGSPWRRKIVTTYYDHWMPDIGAYFLESRGISLRVRCEAVFEVGGRRCMMSVWSSSSSCARLFMAATTAASSSLRLTVWAADS